MNNKYNQSEREKFNAVLLQLNDIYDTDTVILTTHKLHLIIAYYRLPHPTVAVIIVILNYAFTHLEIMTSESK